MDDSPVRMYADYACPFCYLTHHNVETLRASGYSIDFDWHPYDLRADRRDVSGRHDPTQLEYPDAVTQRIEQLRSEAGAEEMLPVQEVPNVDSFNAQVLSLYSQAEYPGLWADIDAGLFAALWQDGRDIADADVLTDIAVTAGVDASKLPQSSTMNSSMIDCPGGLWLRVETASPTYRRSSPRAGLSRSTCQLKTYNSCSAPSSPTRQRERQLLSPSYE